MKYHELEKEGEVILSKKLSKKEKIIKLIAKIEMITDNKLLLK
jgi:hypothetical protein